LRVKRMTDETPRCMTSRNSDVMLAPSNPMQNIRAILELNSSI